MCFWFTPPVPHTLQVKMSARTNAVYSGDYFTSGAQTARTVFPARDSQKKTAAPSLNPEMENTAKQFLFFYCRGPQFYIVVQTLTFLTDAFRCSFEDQFRKPIRNYHFTILSDVSRTRPPSKWRT